MHTDVHPSSLDGVRVFCVLQLFLPALYPLSPIQSIETSNRKIETAKLSSTPRA